MSDAIGWAVCVAFFALWFLDLATPSVERDRLVRQSSELEAERVDEWITEHEVTSLDYERLTAVQMIRLRGAFQRVVFLFIPSPLCKVLVPK